MTKTWSSLGAWHGGTVSSLVLSPQFAQNKVALAATSAGLYRSNSAGTHWLLSMGGFADPSVVALAAEQTDLGPVFFASSEQGRLYRSLDLGQNWTEIESWAGLGVVTAIVLSPAYASDKTVFAATPNGIYRTLDAGESWQEASFGLLDLDVLCLAIAPDFAHSQTLWAGTAHGGLFRTRNAGRAWRESGDGLPDCAVQSIVLSPNFTQDQTLFAGMEEGGVYRSEDSGRSWQLAGEALAELGVNGLATGKDADSPVGYRLLAGTVAGIYASADGGDTWRVELAEVPILGLVLSESGAGLAALYQQGVYARQSMTGEWAVSDGIIAHAPPQVVSSRQGILFALDSDGVLALLHREGKTWQTLSPPDPDAPIVAIACAAVADEECVYVASLAHLYCMPLAQTDWHVLFDPPLTGEDTIVQMAVSTEEDRLRIAISSAEGSIFWLDDAQRQWQPVAHPNQSSPIVSLFFAPNELLYTLTAVENVQQNYDIELWSYDEEWTNLASFESESPAVLTLAADGALFMATQHRLIKLFTDAERHELDVEQHYFAEDTRITALSRAGENGTLYLATTAAIYHSLDQGITWHEFSTLPSASPVVSILPLEEDSQLAVVTLGGEVWALDV
ncbi:MAG: hypothetical protein U0175_24725 [Caldilineaceae bacterium]